MNDIREQVESGNITKDIGAIMKFLSTEKYNGRVDKKAIRDSLQVYLNA